MFRLMVSRRYHHQPNIWKPANALDVAFICEKQISNYLLPGINLIAIFVLNLLTKCANKNICNIFYLAL
jgi:hypothetical protein